MKKISSLLRLAIVTLAVFPVLAVAVPPTTSPYNTDETNSYVQDQTSKVMEQLNQILCFMGAMGPDQMVNLTTNSGNYIALVDKNTCGDGGGNGGQSANTGPAYTSVVVHSARASNSAPMLVKAWLEPQPGNDITVYSSASEAPTTTNPYGVFRMDYCGGGGSCASDKGFINATTNGLSFYSAGTHGTDSDTTALLLNATSSTAGSGGISESHTWNSVSGSSTFKFAYDANYFVRSDETGANPQCFDRSPANADESVWRYGLYDATTGARITRNSGFPVEYTTGGITYNGYIGYYGLWMPVSVPSGDPVNQITYGPSGATKTAYTLLNTGGKLTKFTTANKTLANMNKVTFWYFAQNNVGAEMTAGSQYELYWDTNQFFVSGKQNTLSNNMEPYTTPVPVANSDMVTANPWGIFGWSQMMGGQFGIKGNDFVNLNSTLASTLVRTQTQDIVYPSDFASIGSLKCINDCPTAALITSSNAASGTAYSNQGWNAIASSGVVTYTLNGATGNLIDPVSAPVVSTATSGMNANGVRSGRMVTSADMTTIMTRKDALCGSCGQYNQGDVDLLDVGSSYYVWETGGNSWNQLAILMNGATPITFDPPLQVSFVVPTGVKYGSYQGATISLQYGGFGDLWGIPNECVDVTTNDPCVFSGTPTPQNQQRWTSKFSIPYDATTGVVTAGSTAYLVKPLDKEIRLAKVLSCTGVSLSLPAGTLTYPAVGDWIDPSASAGTKPTFTTAPAPQVIHGVKQF